MSRKIKVLKRIIVSAVISLLAVSETVMTGFSEEVLIGDINRNGIINISDVIIVAAHVKGKRIISHEKLYLADVNVDGQINISDVTVLAARVKGIFVEKTSKEVNFTSTDTSP